MEKRPFGSTGFAVSVVGFGAGQIGSHDMDERMIAQLLNALPELGINLIDTARSYGASEERIGRHLFHRRHEFILSTKVGYTFQDKTDWSYEATMGTIDEALQKLRTDYIDIVHLHSCERRFMEQGEPILALEKAKEQGKIRAMAYSGENEALEYAIASNRFDSIQCSVNIFDQLSIDNYLPGANLKNMGIIAKRPLGNSVWKLETRPDGHGHAVYWDRMHQMKFNKSLIPWNELALRFTAFAPYVHSLIAGTSSLSHLRENIRIVEKGQLDEDVYTMIRDEFNARQQNWDGLI
jgi:aryl-alcohol dehydrogenase-like predicted oxidoreductase